MQDTAPGREHAGKGKAALLCPSVKHFPAVVVISHVTQAHRRKARNSGPARGHRSPLYSLQKIKPAPETGTVLTAGPSLPRIHSQRADNQNSIKQDEIIPVHLIQSIDACQGTKGQNRNQDTVKEIQGMPEAPSPRLPGNSKPDDKKNRHNSGTPCNDYMGRVL